MWTIFSEDNLNNLAVKPYADKRCNLIECQIKYLVLCYTICFQQVQLTEYMILVNNFVARKTHHFFMCRY